MQFKNIIFIFYQSYMGGVIFLECKNIFIFNYHYLISNKCVIHFLC